MWSADESKFISKESTVRIGQNPIMLSRSYRCLNAGNVVRMSGSRVAHCWIFIFFRRIIYVALHLCTLQFLRICFIKNLLMKRRGGLFEPHGFSKKKKRKEKKPTSTKSWKKNL